MKTLVTTVALGLLSFSVYNSLRQRRAQPAHTDVKAEPVQRWEGEGGNVPASNTALGTARTDDLLAPGTQDDAVQKPVGSSMQRKAGVSGSSVG